MKINNLNNIKLLLKITLVLTIIVSNTLSKTLRSTSKSQSKTRQDPAPTKGNTEARYDFEIAKQLARDMAMEIIDFGEGPSKTKKTNALGVCLSMFNRDKELNEPHLKLFFEKCNELYPSPTTGWKNELFDSTIMYPMYKYNLEGGQPCDEALSPYKKEDTQNKTQIANIFNKVFEGFNKMGDVAKKVKFITSFAGRNREKAPSDFFKNLNNESRNTGSGKRK